MAALAVGCSIVAPPTRAQDLGARAQPPVELQEIIVSATKRDEKLNDVPISVQAVTGQELGEMSAVNSADYMRTIAGVQFNDYGPGRGQIFIRGVSTGPDVDTGKESTVGVYIDETPVAEGSSQPDLKLYDIDHIEVLRGPQGTLYGSGSLSGTVRVLTNQPNFTKFEGRVEGRGAFTADGASNPNGAINAMLNIPVAENAAIRLVGYALRDGGFLNNGYTGARDINPEHTTGARLAIRVQPFDALDITFTGFHQKTGDGAYNQVTDHYPSLVIDQSEPANFDDRFDIANLAINYNLGFAKLISATSYLDRQRYFLNDIDYFTDLNFGIPQVTSPILYGAHTVSEELRLVSSGSAPIQWLIGGFYVHRIENYKQIINIFGTPVQSDSNNDFYNAQTQSPTLQTAGFGELSYSPWSALTATVGLRVSDVRRTVRSVKTGFALGGATTAAGASQETPVTPKFNISLKLSADSLLYVQAAKGFRIGGVNPGLPECGAGCAVNVGPTFGSDSLWNYELGTKLQLLNRSLSIDAAVFYIDWSNIQLNINRGDGFNGFLNAGNARSAGLEFESSWRVDDHFTAGGQVTYTDAVLTSLAAGVTGVGAPGDALPDVPRWAGSAYLQWATELAGDKQLFARVDVQHVGQRENQLRSAPGTLPLDAYTLLNIRTGVRVRGFEVALYAVNATDTRAMLDRQLLEGARNGVPITLDRVNINRPATFGISVAKEF